MNRSLAKLLRYKIWEQGDGPANLYLWSLIIALAALYAYFFPFLMEAFGATARVFPALYLAIGALSWGLRGALLVTALNTGLNVALHAYSGMLYEGGILGPLACLFATSLVGILSDLARQLDEQFHERDKAEQSMAEREMRYRTIFNTISEGVCILDHNFVIVDLNDTASRMYGYDKEEMLGSSPTHLVPPEFCNPMDTMARAVRKSGVYMSEAIAMRKDGTQIYVEIRGTRLRLGGKNHYLAVISDVTRKIRTDLELRESEEKYRQLFDMESDGIFMVDTDTGKIIEANASASKLYGYSREELLEMTTDDLSTQPDETRIADQERHEPIPIRHHRRKDGSVFAVEINARHFRWHDRQVQVSAVRDISQRVAAEEEKQRLKSQFYEAQKMESIGTLAGGIAHDFNNLLMSIMGNATLALLNLDPDDKCTSYIDNINRISKNGAQLAKQLLGYARGGKYDPTPTNLNELAVHQNQLFSRTCKNITIHSFLEKNLWSAEVDRGQIDQVLLNIYVNSQQAMPDGGSLTVRSENALLDEDTKLPFPFETGKYVKLSIQDTGFGMDEQTKKRVFEPFFTTKEKGRGTGLGMASSYGIIKNHGGYIAVVSKPGEGTTVTIWLPVTNKEIENELIESREKIALGSGTVLLVDDEDAIIDVTEKMLQALGYNVLTARNGQEALQLYKETQKKIDVVILDIIMPVMGGGETFDRLKAFDPDVNVLLSTGYSMDEKAADIMNRGCKDFLQKPFDISALSVKIAGVMCPN